MNKVLRIGRYFAGAYIVMAICLWGLMHWTGPRADFLYPVGLAILGGLFLTGAWSAVTVLVLWRAEKRQFNGENSN